MTDIDSKMIKLESSDGAVVEISVKAAQMSEFIKNALSLEDDDIDLTKELKVDCKRVGSKTLESVVHYLEYYKTTPQAEIPDPTKDVIAATFEEVVPQEWYRNYVTALQIDGMWRVRSAAHFMLIEPLTYLTNVWLAFHLMDKSRDEMHEILHIPKMTPEQEAKAREEHPWLFICLEEDLPEPEGEAVADPDEVDDDDEDDDDEEE